MDDRRLEDKLDKITEKIASIDVTLAKVQVNVDEHVRRSTNLEDRVVPLETQLAMLNGALKLLGVLAMVVGLIAGFLKLLGKI